MIKTLDIKYEYAIQLKQGVFMVSMAQIDKIVSEVNNLEEKIVFFHKIEEIFDTFDVQNDKDIPIESAFGLWENRNITKETLRKKAWMKN
jgi:hypothetical protein